ncbi:MAG: phospholipase D-like domain-containing protein [Burkholderiales bacterium]|nr:phospholipase D-like domain-containing protein [Burkholderiales bacterium]
MRALGTPDPDADSDIAALAAAATDLREAAEQAFSRMAGAPLVAGNRLRLLTDVRAHFDAWLEAIRGARRKIHLESYIFADDAVGREFAEALAAKAREGVRVRVVYDWLGGLGTTSSRLVRAMTAAGIEVRAFNPFRFASPFGWLARDHRKSLVVDGALASVTGICLSARWLGDPGRGVPPWRDTGVMIEGPAVADLERAFAEAWAACGAPLPREDLTPRRAIAAAGDAALRVIATVPNTAAIYRLDQLVASLARERLWLADAYFVGTPAYVQTLRAAAADGVDVRLLVPGASDVPVISPLSRAGYRPLLEAGVRVFEWNGSMMHAKTAVADGRWARVGSTNLNIASWLGNWELDVAIDDERFGAEMEAAYEGDLANATEIVLRERSHVRLRSPRRAALPHRGPRGSAGRAAAGALRLGNVVGAALGARRVLGPAESRLMLAAAVLAFAVALLLFFYPRVIAYPLAVVAAWVAVTLVIQARRLHGDGRARSRRKRPPRRNRPPPELGPPERE